VLFAIVPANAQDATVGGLRISGGWVRESIGPAPTGAAYMDFHNTSARTITLTGATSPAADKVVLHATTRDGNVLRMRPIESLEIRPGETVSLAPGGHHFMFTGVKTPFRSGMSVALTLILSDGRTVTVAAPVRSIQGGAAQPHHGDHESHHDKAQGDNEHHGGAHSDEPHHGANAWNAPAHLAQRANPIDATHTSVDRGRALFSATCADCHGSDARGSGPHAESLETKPADLSVMGRAHPPGDIAWKIESGRGDMPGFGKALSERDIWDLVNFVRQVGDGRGEHHHGQHE